MSVGHHLLGVVALDVGEEARVRGLAHDRGLATVVVDDDVAALAPGTRTPHPRSPGPALVGLLEPGALQRVPDVGRAPRAR